MRNELHASIYGKNVKLEFTNVREDRTLVTDRVVKVGGTTFGRRPNGSLVIFGMNHSVYHRLPARGAMRYLEAAWRLGALKKSIYDRYIAMEEKRQVRDHATSSASNALDYIKATGIEPPDPFRKALEKMAGR